MKWFRALTLLLSIVWAIMFILFVIGLYTPGGVMIGGNFFLMSLALLYVGLEAD